MLLPRPGQVYRHYKSTGGDHHTYEVIGLAKHSETQELMVVYRPLFHGEDTRLGDAEMAVRPLHMWDQSVWCRGKEVSRFSLLDDHDVGC